MREVGSRESESWISESVGMGRMRQPTTLWRIFHFFFAGDSLERVRLTMSILAFRIISISPSLQAWIWSMCANQRSHSHLVACGFFFRRFSDCPRRSVWVLPTTRGIWMLCRIHERPTQQLALFLGRWELSVTPGRDPSWPSTPPPRARKKTVPFWVCFVSVRN